LPPGGAQPGTSGPEPGADDPEPGAGNPEPGADDREHGAGNPEPGPDDPEPGEAPLRVSTLELFFDLVFAFTLTRLTTLLTRHLSVPGAVQVVLVFGVLWWM
jgi:hypothetical protein